MAELTKEQLEDLVVKMREGIVNAQTIIKKQSLQLDTLLSDTAGYGVVLDVHRKEYRRPSDAYPVGSWFEVVGKNTNGSFLGDIGQVKAQRNDQELKVQMLSGEELYVNAGDRRIVPLAHTSDDYVVVYSQGTILRCEIPQGKLGTQLRFGQSVFMTQKTHQIMGIADDNVNLLGEIQQVAEVLDSNRIVIAAGDGQRVVLCNPDDKIHKDDRVQLDPSGVIVRKVLPKQKTNRLGKRIDTTWRDIGGLSQAKADLLYAIQTKSANAKVARAYPNLRQTKGVLLYGLPGNGKTLLAKAAAHHLAGDSENVGFFAVNGPELLSRFVGDAELAIRNLFGQASEYFKDTGKTPVIFFDEADALFPSRGTTISSDVNKTIVAQYLSCQDGLEGQNALVILATNRSDLLDPAVTRPGRCDFHIKVSAPSQQDAVDVLRIHFTDVPTSKELDDPIGYTVKLAYHQALAIYKMSTSKGECSYRLADGMSAAMLAGIVGDAQDRAFRRDAQSGKVTGVSKEDIQLAVYGKYKAMRDLDSRDMLRQYQADNALEISDVQRIEIVSQEVLNV